VLSGDADGEADSSGEAAGEADGDADSVEVFFFGDADGEASLVALVFFDEVEVELVPVPAFLVVDVAVVFLDDAVAECDVVAAVSCLCAQDATKAAPAMTVIKPRTNFFIMTGLYS
jgi:hypothetical protein